MPGLYIVSLIINLYEECIRQNARLDDSQRRIKIARRNINNFRYAYDTTLIAESEEELKSLLMRVKEESEKVELKLNIKKMEIFVSSAIPSWQINGENWKQWQISFSWALKWLIGKDPDAGRDWEKEEKGPTEDDGWHHQLDGHDFE